MVPNIGFGLLWLGFSVYALILAPGNQIDALSLVQKLVMMDWQGINPLILALFNLMGIWPMIYGCVLFADGREQRLPAWPFVSLSFALGAFALLPYLSLRQVPRSHPLENLNWTLKFWDSRGLAVGLGIGAIALLYFGFTQGDWADFVHQWQTNRFIHVMGLDFCILSFLFPAILSADMSRRGMPTQTPLFWAIALVPLLGSLAYLCWRPSLSSGAEPIGG